MTPLVSEDETSRNTKSIAMVTATRFFYLMEEDLDDPFRNGYVKGIQPGIDRLSGLASLTSSSAKEIEYSKTLRAVCAVLGQNAERAKFVRFYEMDRKDEGKYIPRDVATLVVTGDVHQGDVIATVPWEARHDDDNPHFKRHKELYKDNPRSQLPVIMRYNDENLCWPVLRQRNDHGTYDLHSWAVDVTALLYTKRDDSNIHHQSLSSDVSKTFWDRMEIANVEETFLLHCDDIISLLILRERVPESFDFPATTATCISHALLSQNMVNDLQSWNRVLVEHDLEKRSGERERRQKWDQRVDKSKRFLSSVLG